MTSFRDKIRKSIESASTKETAASWQDKLKQDIAALAKKFKIEGFDPKRTVVNSKIVIVYTKHHDAEAGESENEKAVNAEEFAEAVGKLVGAGEWIQPRFIGNDIGWELKRNADKDGPPASKETGKPFWLEKGTIDQFSRKLKSYNPNLSVKYTAEEGEGTDAEFDIVSKKSKLVLYSIQISRLGKAVFIPVRHNYVKGKLKSNSVGKPFPNPLKATDALIRMIERDKTPGYYAGETASTKETAAPKIRISIRVDSSPVEGASDAFTIVNLDDLEAFSSFDLATPLNKAITAYGKLDGSEWGEFYVNLKRGADPDKASTALKKALEVVLKAMLGKQFGGITFKGSESASVENAASAVDEVTQDLNELKKLGTNVPQKAFDLAKKYAEEFRNGGMRIADISNALITMSLTKDPAKAKRRVESASVETAKKHKSTTKMVAKIAAIIQAMGMDEGQWDAVSKQVFKKAFGGKRERAAVEIANVKQAQSIVNLTKRFDKGIKLPKGDDDMWPEKTVKAHLNDPDMKGDYAPITVKGESDDHFWVKTKGDDEIMGAVYKKDSKWYAFMGTSAMCVGSYSTKDLAAGAVVLDYNG